MNEEEERRETRRLLEESAREFTMKEVLPAANELDGKAGEEGDIPEGLKGKLAEMGYFGIAIPEEYGGLGLGAYEYCVITEHLSRGWMSVGSLIARGNGMFGQHMFSEEQRRRYLPKAARGEWLSAVALSEPGVGSDLAGISCRATLEGDEWVFRGNKSWCTYADGADYILLYARTSPPPDGTRRHLGISAFMVEKERGALPKGCKGSPVPKIGYHGWRTWELSFEGTRVGREAMIGEEGKAFYYMAHGLETARAHTAARSVGLAQGGLEDAILYAGERRQFGLPIGEFQAIRFKLARMATEVEAARRLTRYVCEEIDEGRRCDKEASMAKLYASEVAERVTSEAIQVLGGAGYTKWHAAERYWRDARLTRIFEGSSEIQMRVISDALLGRSVVERDAVARVFSGDLEI